MHPMTSVRTMCVVLPIERKDTHTNPNSHTNILLKFVDFCVFLSWFEICFGSEKCPNVVNGKSLKNLGSQSTRRDFLEFERKSFRIMKLVCFPVLLHFGDGGRRGGMGHIVGIMIIYSKIEILLFTWPLCRGLVSILIRPHFLS